jgi:integrase
LLALLPSDIDWLHKNMTIARSLEQTAAGLRTKCAKGGKQRIFSLPDTAILAVLFQRDTQTEARRLFRIDVQRSGADFLWAQRRISRVRSTLSDDRAPPPESWRERREPATLRHMHASTLLSRGVPVATVSKRLGHAQPRVTNRV